MRTGTVSVLNRTEKTQSGGAVAKDDRQTFSSE